MTVLPEFLAVEDVELLHDEQLRLFGGLDGVRDRGALEAAVAMPAASFGGEFSARTCSKEQFASLLEQLAKPFIDD